MSDTLTSGQCLCGAVRYRVNGPPLRMAQCHCKHCQRASGSGHMSLAFFKSEQLAIEGEYREFASVADSGNQNIRGFCPTCGARLFGRNSARPGVVAVTAGSADDNDWFEPQAVVYTAEQPRWDLTREDIPRFAVMPPPA